MEDIELGGNITLTGFSEREHAEMIVIKKIAGQYARKMSDNLKNFEGLKLTMKEVHKKTEGAEKFEVHAMAEAGKNYNSEVTDKNLFVALDSVLKKVYAEAESDQAKK